MPNQLVSIRKMEIMGGFLIQLDKETGQLMPGFSTK